MIVIGLISGTSADAIDAALVEVTGEPPELALRVIQFVGHPWPNAVREQVFASFRPESSAVDRLCALNFRVAEEFAAAAESVARAAGISLRDVDLIGSHGQTVWHAVGADDAVKSTLQIGQPAVIAERTGVTVVGDLRARDVAAGGQGAPMVGYTDYLLLRHATQTRAVQNIGGIANVTVLPAGARPEQVFAFDTGPGNMLIDDAITRMTDGTMTYDRDGEVGARGKVDERLLAELMEHPYLALPLPKTTGREQFGRQLGAEIWERARARGMAAEDIVATLTRYTAASIAQAYERFVGRVDEVLVGGGGADNPTLMRMLAEELPKARVRRSDEVGMPADGKEAIAFAVLAYETVHGRPGNLPSVTGAAGPRVLGAIAPGDNYTRLMSRIFGASV